MNDDVLEKRNMETEAKLHALSKGWEYDQSQSRGDLSSKDVSDRDVSDDLGGTVRGS